MPKSLNDMDKLLVRLYQAAVAAVNEAHRQKKSIDGAINWGDLHVVHVESYVTNYGEAGLRVWLEEAAPDNVELWEFVADRLRRAGFPAVEVRTEW